MKFFDLFLERLPDPRPRNYATYTVACQRLYDDYVNWARLQFGPPLDKTAFWAALRGWEPRVAIQDVGRGKEFINVRYLGFFFKRRPLW